MTTSYSLRSASPALTRADAVVVGVLAADQGPILAPGAEDVSREYGRKLRPLLASLGVTGTAGEAITVPTHGTIRTPLVVLVGIGPHVSPDSVRTAAGVAARHVANASSIALALPAHDTHLVDAVVQGHRLGSYRFTRYHSRADDRDAPGDVVVLSSVARTDEAKSAFARAHVVSDAVARTRDWVNTAPADLTPALFAEAVTDAHTAATKGRGGPPLDLEVFDESRLAELGCGGILSVGLSSAAPPRLVQLTYRPARPALHVALVGKGVTFDSGGLTIKPASSMPAMKSDMAGAAAVVQATLALAALQSPVAITCIAPMAENMLSGTSSRPGDVVTTLSGRTVELANIDAEGRMLLCDALTMAERAAPDIIIDVATLTAHMRIALGDQVAGVMGNSELINAIATAGELAGEDHWPMPIPEEMTERIASSTVADLLQSDWVRWGGGLYAAAFLREFTNEIPWAHLDIAGCAFTTSTRGHITPGGTGWGTATLIGLVEALAIQRAAD